MARKIRLRYTGLIAFTAQVFSVFTGLAFLTFLTRNVTVEDFGVWAYIMLVITHIYFPRFHKGLNYLGGRILRCNANLFYKFLYGLSWGYSFWAID